MKSQKCRYLKKVVFRLVQARFGASFVHPVDVDRLRSLDPPHSSALAEVVTDPIRGEFAQDPFPIINITLIFLLRYILLVCILFQVAGCKVNSVMIYNYKVAWFNSQNISQEYILWHILDKFA